MAFKSVPAGHLAAIVTSLEMQKKPPLRPLPPSLFRLEKWDAPTPDKYRQLFRRIGHAWLWVSRLMLDDAELSAIIHDENITIYAVKDRQGLEIGMLELDFRQAAACEIAFLGLIPELIGKGHGGWLLQFALQNAWGRKGIERVWLHSCTHDAPAAIPLYRKYGFTPFRREIEILPDPRLSGLIPRDAAPHIALLDGG